MFRAINKNNNTSVISLNRFTGEDFALLKDKCKKNILICPWCFEAVSFRVCLNKRNHFAHKSLNNCPFNNESQIILETRALLYQWLVAKFSNKPGWVIDIEVNIGNLSIEKKVDCLVHNNKQSFAYIILDKGLKSDFRSELHNCISNKYISVSYIFPWDNFKVDSHNPSYFFLTPTERYFISKRDYDYSIDFIKPIQGSLYYISAQNNLLKLIRRIQLVHPPQLFEGTIVDINLNDVLISPKTGEFVLPGEHEELTKYQKKLEEHNQSIIQTSSSHKHNSNSQATVTHETPIATECSLPTCVHCKRQTSDWWSYDGSKNTCKCNDCYFKGLY